MKRSVLILGANGFIGSTLCQAILEKTTWTVYGMDLSDHKLTACAGNERFHFFKGDILRDIDWIKEHVQKCDTVLPLVAIANPMFYVQKPLEVFELDFEANLRIVRECVQHKKHLIFPSTSEVYGMSTDAEFNEETTNLVLGPIHKQRWIYSCSKQLMDRIIFAYGVHENLNYTIFRPFNWLGPRMDDVYAKKADTSRAVIQFISNIIYKRPITLVNGGSQRRCFTDIDEGVDALIRMIKNENNQAHQKIFNIGNPNNNYSMKEVAELLIETFKEYPKFKENADQCNLKILQAEEHFGKHYEDVENRVPSIKNAQNYLGWTPHTPLQDILRKTLTYHLIEHPQDIA